MGGSYGFQEKLRDQLSSTEYKKRLYKKLTANKLSLKEGGSGASGGGGEEVHFVVTRPKSLDPPLPR